MRLDHRHAPWAIFTFVATAIASLLYLANFFPDKLLFPIDLPSWLGPVPPLRNTFGGTPLGLIFGTIAFLIFLFASALGVRKKKRLWRIGHVQMWLRAHIWLTILTVPLVLFHCGFQSGGAHTSVLLWLYAFVMGSGFFGLALQQFMPRLMKERLPNEVVFEQIPHIREKLFEAALTLRQELRNAGKPPAPAAGAKAAPAAEAAAVATVATVVAPVEEDESPTIIGEFLDEEALPYLRARRGSSRRLGDQRTADDLFRLLKLNVTDKWRPRVEMLHQWCADRRQMDLQQRLHHWLHGWLIIHVPTSFALLIMTAWHAWAAVSFLIVP
ncbi:MAG TPA: hypothetical protein VF614_12350 [Chthoniobacteraceae bacterium]|jgi:hypothetical protein